MISQFLRKTFFSFMTLINRCSKSYTLNLLIIIDLRESDH